MNSRVNQKTAGSEATPQADAPSEFDSLLRSGNRRSGAAPGTGPSHAPAFVNTRERAPTGATAHVGRIASVDAVGAISVALPGWAHAIPARLATPLSADQVLAAIECAQPVVLMFEEGDPLRPIIMGLVMGRLDTTLQAAPGEAHDSQDAPPVIEADVDGKRVRVTARDEIVLQCGQASVTLRRNGRIVIRGTHVETDSEGTNRIKGGQVRIN